MYNWLPGGLSHRTGDLRGIERARSGTAGLVPTKLSFAVTRVQTATALNAASWSIVRERLGDDPAPGRETKTMKKSRCTEEPIAFALRRAEGGASSRTECRKMGVSEQTLFRRRRTFTGMGVAEVRPLKQLEEEIRKCYSTGTPSMPIQSRNGRTMDRSTSSVQASACAGLSSGWMHWSKTFRIRGHCGGAQRAGPWATPETRHRGPPSLARPQAGHPTYPRPWFEMAHMPTPKPRCQGSPG